MRMTASVPTSPQKTSSCSELFARLSPTRRGRGQLVLLALVWERGPGRRRCLDGWGQAEGGHHALWSACSPVSPAQTFTVQAADGARVRGERRGAGEVQDTQSRGHLQLLKRGKPLEGLPVNRLISFLYR